MTPRLTILVAVALAALSLSIAACGGEDEAEEGQQGTAAQTQETATDEGGAAEATGDLGEARVLALAEQNDSGLSGEATISPTSDEAVKVAIDLEDSGDVPRPAHIHEGSCDELGAIAFPLDNVEGGNSSTAVDVSLQELEDGDYAINVHESEEAIETYVACTDI